MRPGTGPRATGPPARWRPWQRAAVTGLLLRHRSRGTPVVVGRGVGRAGEQLEVITLAELGSASVDMSTLVIVGSSATRVRDRGGGRVVFTPRHYGAAGAAASARRRRGTPASARPSAADG